MNGTTLVGVGFALGSLGYLNRWVPDETWLRSPHPRNHAKEGFVSQKKTVIAIGRAAIEERYGVAFRKSEEPLDARRFKDLWIVYGYKPVYALGGTVIVEISAKTGAVRNVYAEQ